MSSGNLRTELPLLALPVLLQGSSYLFTKVAVVEMPPVTPIALRALDTAIFLLLVTGAKSEKLPRDLLTWQMLLVRAIFNSNGAWNVLARGQQYVGSGLAWRHYTKETIGQLMSGEVDIAFANANFPLPEGLAGQVLRPMKRYVLARRGHPASNDWSAESWMRYPHVVVRIPAAIHGTVEEHLASLGLKRRIGLHAASWSGIASALKGTDMLSNTIGLAILECKEGKSLQIFEPPEPMPDLVFRVMWKAELDADPALSWLRSIVLRTFDDLFAEVDKWIAASDIIQSRRVQR